MHKESASRASEASPGPGEARRPLNRLDLTRLMSGAARDLVVDAARFASASGSHDLDTDHLLWSALRREPLRTLLRQAGADPDALDRALARPEIQDGQGEPALLLTPATKRALLEAHRISRATGSSYIGPEHIVMALAAMTKLPVVPPPLDDYKPSGTGVTGGRPVRGSGG